MSAAARDALLFGLATGLAVCTKFSGIPFIGLALITLGLAHHFVAARPAAAGAPVFSSGRAAASASWSTRLVGLAIAAAAVLVPVWLAYGPRAPDEARVAVRFDWAVSYLLMHGGFDHALGVLLSHVWLPRELKDLVNGVVAVKAHNDSGHLSYFMGEVRKTGWWDFYLVALAVKTPIPLLMAGPLGVAWLARTGWRTRDSWALAPLVLVVTLLGFASTFSRINIGIRHILIVYPFLALGAAYVAQRAWRASVAQRQPRRALAGAAVVLALLAWQLSTLWRAYPDYLPYFNEAVAHPERVLVDSDLDWGQDLYRLEQRAAQLHIRRLSLAYRGTADLAREPLPQLHILPPHQPVTGWVAVSELARTRDAGDYQWLDAYRPLERVGKSIDLYYIP